MTLLLVIDQSSNVLESLPIAAFLFASQLLSWSVDLPHMSHHRKLRCKTFYLTNLGTLVPKPTMTIIKKPGKKIEKFYLANKSITGQFDITGAVTLLAAVSFPAKLS